MSYVKDNLIVSGDFNSYAGLTGTAAASAVAATSVAGYLWGVGYGDRGYGESSPALAAMNAGGILKSSDWGNLRTVLSNLATWQQTSTTLLPTAAKVAQGAAVEAHNSSAPTNDPYGIPALLSTLDANRLNYSISNMTATAGAAATSRASTWGGGTGGITCEFSVTFVDENAARYFFNTGGEIRITLNHPSTATSRDSSWNTMLSGFVAAFRANQTARTGGSYGTAQSIGYYNLTTVYQTIINGSNTGVSPYTVNDFYVDAKASTITGLNGAKGSVIHFRIRLVDEQTNAFSDIVQSGTVAQIGHLRATSGVVTAKAAPTCAVMTAF